MGRIWKIDEGAGGNKEEVSRGLFSGDHGSGLYPLEVTVTFKNVRFSRFFPRKMCITNTQTFDVKLQGQVPPRPQSPPLGPQRSWFTLPPAESFRTNVGKQPKMLWTELWTAPWTVPWMELWTVSWTEPWIASTVQVGCGA